MRGLPSLNPLTRKLAHFSPMPAVEREVLDGLAADEKSFPADVDIATEGNVARFGFLMKEGTAIRYRDLPDGGRQIITFLIAGDLCDLHAFAPSVMDHSIGTITPVRVAPISRAKMMEAFLRYPRIAAALRWSALQEEAMLRERIVALGRRDARGRLAYLFCELLWRHEAIGLAANNAFRLELTQLELGDTLGLTAVHVNHVFKEFRKRRLIRIEQKVLTLQDLPELQRIAGFSSNYLKLNVPAGELARIFDAQEPTVIPAGDKS
jgi:CRP-like cAMP-binding protein